MNDFSVIVAIDLDGAIGRSDTNSIPWHLPSDLAFFKEQTLGKTIVMGSRTWESLPFKPLKGRRNVVLTRRRGLLEGVDAQYSSLEDALEKEQDVVVIGGASLYEECFKYNPKTLYITVVHQRSKGDVKFPVDGESLKGAGSFRKGNTYFINMKNVKMQENKIDFAFTEWKRLDGGKLSDNYTHSSAQEGNAVTTTLTKIATGETRTFNCANGSLRGINYLMDSLTDEQCESWFEDKSAKRKKKKEK